MKIFDKYKEEIVFSKIPQKCICPYCNVEITTLVTYKNSYPSYLIIVINLLLTPFLLSIVLNIATLILTKTLIHKCSICDNELGTDGKIFAYLGIRDKIFSVKITELGIIITRKIIIGVILSFLIFLILFYKIKYYKFVSDEQIIPNYDNWTEYLTNCNKQALHESPSVSSYCVERYLDKTIINWEGYVIKINDKRESYYHRYMDHAVTILLKMLPSEKELEPDIVLTLDTDEIDEYANIINNLHRGKKVGFNATIKSFGDDGRKRHFHLVNLFEVDGFLEIDPNLGIEGRFDPNNKNSFRGKNIKHEDKGY